jgi:hypothetical protein
MEEAMKRDYFLGKVAKDQNWKGGELQVPFMGAHASSISYGQLTDEAKINEDKPVLGTVGGYKEIWGAMVFNDHDLSRHDSLEQSFLKIIPDRIESFVDRMKEAVSINLLNGSHIASVVFGDAAEDLANGIIVADRPARLQINQFLEIGIPGLPGVDNRTAALADGGVYITAIDMSSGALTVSATQGGAAVDLSTSAIAAGDKFYVKGAREVDAAGRTKGFTSLRSQLISNPLVAGSSSTIFGINKKSYPHLQSVEISGNGVVASGFLDLLFDAYNKTREIGKGNPTDMVMSYKNLAAAMRALELGGSESTGGAKSTYGREFSVADTRVSAFGWTEIDVVGVKGRMTLVGVQEMDDDVVYLLDWRGIKLHSNGMFERRTAPDGKQFYETRSPAGYKYIVDTRFFGELVVSKPSHCGVIHSLNL